MAQFSVQARLHTSSLSGRGANQALSSNAKPMHPFMQQVFDLNANMRANVNVTRKIASENDKGS
jgi:hypothetical protein